MKCIILFLIPILLCSCSTSRHVQMQVAEHIHKDTIYLSNIQYDSIYVSQGRSSEYHLNPLNPLKPTETDTLIIKEVSTQYRYKLLRDTVRIVQRDSIPYEVRITEVSEVKYTPPLTKVLAHVGAISILVLLILTFTKLKHF